MMSVMSNNEFSCFDDNLFSHEKRPVGYIHPKNGHTTFRLITMLVQQKMIYPYFDGCIPTKRDKHCNFQDGGSYCLTLIVEPL